LNAGTLVPDHREPDKSASRFRCTATGRRETLFSPTWVQTAHPIQGYQVPRSEHAVRTILLGLAMLAVAKIWYQDHTYRTAMADAIVEAYRDRALEVCRRNTVKRVGGARDLAASTWNVTSTAETVIGNPELSVAIWDTQNALWNQRFRDLHIVLTSAAGERCSYDVRQGAATMTASR
jgi:hypothetical protein